MTHPMTRKGAIEPPLANAFGRRERQIMEVLYRGNCLSVADVREGLPDPPSYSAVRTMLGVLERKGYIVHEERGRAFYYRPSLPKNRVRHGVLAHMVKTFFNGSEAELVAALLEPRHKLRKSELDRLALLIEEAREDGR
jgi:predicted transcriptional regulator